MRAAMFAAEYNYNLTESNMKTISRSGYKQTKYTEDKNFAIDTTFVLFFLAVESGRTFLSLSFDNIFMFATVLMVAVLPYFLLSNEKPTFGNWIFGRSLIVGFAVLLGAMFKQSLGVVLPEMFRFLPMTLIIVTAMLSCYIQFLGFFKFRLAK